MNDGNPQLEDGFIRIANELYDVVLAWPFTAIELKIIMAILRKTYGFRKKHDVISLGQFYAMTGIKKQNSTRPLRDLIVREIVNCDGAGHRRLLSINKHYQQWNKSKVINSITPKVMTSITPTPIQKYLNPLPKVIDPITQSNGMHYEKVMESITTKDNKDNLKTIFKDSGPKNKIDHKMIRPEIKEIQAYIADKNLDVDGCAFFHHYEGIGWKVGKNPMRKWKSTLQTWHQKNQREKNNGSGGSTFKSTQRKLREKLAAMHESTPKSYD